MADVEDRNVRRVTLFMMVTSTVALELAVAEPDRAIRHVVLTSLGMLVAPTLVLGLVFDRGSWSARRHGAVGHTPVLTPFVVVLLLGIFLLPEVDALVRFLWQRRPAMLEVLLLASLRNLGLGLAVLSRRPVCSRLCALISLFLILVAASLGEGRLLLALVGLHAVGGTSWLMLAYWKRLDSLDREEASAPRSVPWGTSVWILGVVVCVLAGVAIGPTRAATALVGLVPTSGGTEWNDPEARGGVNDGDNEVSASENPQSVGFTRSEIYLDTDRPSLYDAFNEAYGEPTKRKTERMIALGPQDVKEQKERPTENLHSGREFSLVRRKPERPTRRPREREAKALVYVKGPTPLHLRLKSYDHFNGHTWHEEGHCGVDCPLEKLGRSAWFRLDWPTPSIFGETVSHAIRIGALDSSALPVPGHLDRFRVGSVDRAEFFGWAQDGILSMVQRTVPAGTTIETSAKVVDPKLLAAYEDVALPRPGDTSVDPALAALARSWVAGKSRGWAQVAAVVETLRGSYKHTSGQVVVDGELDPAIEFLLRSRQGPDYLFATSAVLLLRSLGYRARLVSGFYVDPRRIDLRTGYTPVVREDVHFWAEVMLRGGTWVAIEPTPGYELLRPSPGWGERLVAALGSAARRVARHPFECGATLLAVLLIVRFRLRGLDVVSTLAWRLSGGRGGRRGTLATLALVESRATRAGRPRPPGATPSRWYAPLALGFPGEPGAELARLVRLADWARYSPEGTPPPFSLSDLDIRATCRRVVRSWTLARFRACDISPTVERRMTS